MSRNPACFSLITAVYVSGCAPAPPLPAGYLIVPMLTARMAAPCPAAPLLTDSTLGSLAAADAALATAYAACAEKHESVVESYRAIYHAAEAARK